MAQCAQVVHRNGRHSGLFSPIAALNFIHKPRRMAWISLFRSGVIAITRGLSDQGNAAVPASMTTDASRTMPEPAPQPAHERHAPAARPRHCQPTRWPLLPSDAVAGFDDGDLAEAIDPATVRQPLEETGRAEHAARRSRPNTSPPARPPVRASAAPRAPVSHAESTNFITVDKRAWACGRWS